MECKLSLQRKTLKLSGEQDQDQFIQLYKAGVVRTSKARIARTSKQGSSQLQSRDHENFEAKIPETLKQESSELQSRVISTFKAGDHQNFKRGDCQNFKGGNHLNFKRKDHVIIRTFSANFEVIRKHVSSELHN
jgi:hypothetical protein